MEYVKPLDPEENCYSQSHEYLLAEKLIQNGYNPFTHIFFNESEWEYLPVKRFLCTKIVQNWAKVTIMFDRSTYIRTRTNVKVKFTDKLAAFGKCNFTLRIYCLMFTAIFNFSLLGGTLGLFTGMSILNMIEIAFWLLKFLNKVSFKVGVESNRIERISN